MVRTVRCSGPGCGAPMESPRLAATNHLAPVRFREGLTTAYVKHMLNAGVRGYEALESVEEITIKVQAASIGETWR
jgi:hypothetical protein